MEINKRTSNFFIAVGYCLVAIIVMLNYHGQVKEKKQLSSGSVFLPSEQTDKTSQTTFLSKQLEEEKRANQEMREMLTHLQSAMTQGNNVNDAPILSSFNPEPPALPNLDDQFLENINKPRSNPFIPEKNPFLDKRQKTHRVNNMTASQFYLKTDAKLPFIISGANSKTDFFSNF